LFSPVPTETIIFYLSLAGGGIPDTITRVKGWLWFDEVRDQRCVFHKSGRNRFGFFPQGGWLGRPRVELIFLGHDGDYTELLDQLQSICVVATENDHVVDTLPPAANGSISEQALYKAAADIVESSDLFDLWTPSSNGDGDADNAGRSLLQFRLTAVKRYNFPYDVLIHRFGIDMNHLNESFGM